MQQLDNEELAAPVDHRQQPVDGDDDNEEIDVVAIDSPLVPHGQLEFAPLAQHVLVRPSTAGEPHDPTHSSSSETVAAAAIAAAHEKRAVSPGYIRQETTRTTLNRSRDDEISFQRCAAD